LDICLVLKGGDVESGESGESKSESWALKDISASGEEMKEDQRTVLFWSSRTRITRLCQEEEKGGGCD